MEEKTQLRNHWPSLMPTGSKAELPPTSPPRHGLSRPWDPVAPAPFGPLEAQQSLSRSRDGGASMRTLETQ